MNEPVSKVVIVELSGPICIPLGDVKHFRKAILVRRVGYNSGKDAMWQIEDDQTVQIQMVERSQISPPDVVTTEIKPKDEIPF